MDVESMHRREHAIVAGGASGIGSEVAGRLLKRGVAVTVLDVNPLGAAALDAPPGLLEVIETDITDADAVDTAFRTAEERIGPVNRLVVSAGAHGQLLNTVHLDLGAWQHLMDVHVRGALLLAQAFGSRLLSADRDRAQDASMVSIGSTTGITASRKQGDYGPAKAALAQLTRVLAMEWAEAGIRANTVAPGQTLTPFVESMVANGYDLSETERRTPLGRLARVDEVASVIEFLLLDATYVTGVVLPVDGGWTALGR
ncbi:SDR family oxidoreductase [Streptomyces sp. NPDC048191]|uniref:SDR family NAD(P)-dependent oxidoreductase n=1 Tax=Streptomyces sp. NPDC048191 TaxID=3155484 RepID=UPI0033E15E30